MHWVVEVCRGVSWICLVLFWTGLIWVAFDSWNASVSVYSSLFLGLAMMSARLILYSLSFQLLTMCKYLISKATTITNSWFPSIYFVPTQFHGDNGFNIVVLSLIHSFSHMFHTIGNIRYVRIMNQDPFKISTISGILLLVMMVVITIPVIPLIRKRLFEWFYYLHWLWVFLCFGLMVHSSQQLFSRQYSIFFLPGSLGMYTIDFVCRMHQIMKKHLVSMVKVQHPYLDVNIQNNYFALPGQYIMTRVDPVAKAQSHPFSLVGITDTIKTIRIKPIGGWTKKLMRSYLSNDYPLHLSISGPFYSMLQDYHHFENVILISSGVGHTPFLSIIESESQSRRVNAIHCHMIFSSFQELHSVHCDIRRMLVPKHVKIELWFRYTPTPSEHLSLSSDVKVHYSSINISKVIASVDKTKCGTFIVASRKTMLSKENMRLLETMGHVFVL